MICNFYPLLFIYLFFSPLRLISLLQDDAENYAESKKLINAVLTAGALDVNRPAVKIAAFLVLTFEDEIVCAL